jgi:signal transduction histidine kinase
VVISLYVANALSLRWSADVEYAAFMVAREAVNNALQHAEPDHISIHLSGAPCSLILTVADDGSGMPVDESPSPIRKVGHLGLVGMRERSFAISAVLEISPAIDGGTTVTLRWEDDDEPSLPD